MAYVDVYTSSEDGYLFGVGGGYDSMNNTSVNLISANSSSSSTSEFQAFTLHDTSTSNLQSLGMPAGSTVTGWDYNIYCFSASNAGFGAWFLQRCASTATTLSGSFWDDPNATNFPASYFASVGSWGTGAYTNFGTFSDSLGSQTNIQILCSVSSSPGESAYFYANETGSNSAFIRVYYTPPATGTHQLASLGVGR